MVRTLKVSMERKTFLVRFEGEAGGKWCSLTEHSRGSVFALGFEKEEVYKALRVRFQQKVNFSGKVEEGRRDFSQHVGPLYRSFANVVREEDPGEEALFQSGDG
ncbi:hypothetical protein CK203_027283 [Vitis vinifera]|uniref:Uncharacterized protein n=1 Tax=Vitis vinifera TaxID=29760 RepID=A0A438J9K3_VITVI|nr:hypothetical protein CK203_027283 [Vitis vinifera]